MGDFGTGDIAEKTVYPTLVLACHGAEIAPSLGGELDAEHAAVGPVLGARDESVLHQPRDDGRDVAVGDEQELRKRAHGEAVGLALQRGQHVEARQGRAEARVQHRARLLLDGRGGGQKPQPEPERLFRMRRVVHHITSPPATAIAWPVMECASSETNHATVSATSSGSIRRPCGLTPASSARASASLRLVLAAILATASRTISVS